MLWSAEFKLNALYRAPRPKRWRFAIAPGADFATDDYWDDLKLAPEVEPGIRRRVWDTNMYTITFEIMHEIINGVSYVTKRISTDYFVYWNLVGEDSWNFEYESMGREAFFEKFLEERHPTIYQQHMGPNSQDFITTLSQHFGSTASSLYRLLEIHTYDFFQELFGPGNVFKAHVPYDTMEVD